MDPVILEIYRAYFEREWMKTVGLPEEVSLASSLQNKVRHSGASGLLGDPFSNPFEFLFVDTESVKNAFEFVKTHSTVRHKYGL